MEVLIYAKTITGPLKLLQREIEKVIPHNGIEEFNDINTLCQQLKNSTITKNNETIAILLIDNQNELLELIKMRKQLTETKIILILPDKEPETIKLGHTLFPRYLDFVDSNFTEVGEVLKKIKQNNSMRAGQ